MEAEGYDYARYASYVLDAAALEYEFLPELGASLSWLGERIVQEGIRETLTEAEKEAWADVLDVKVLWVYTRDTLGCRWSCPV